LKKGDVILDCNGVRLDSATDFAKLVSKSGSSSLTLTVQRGEETMTKKLSPALASDGSGWKAGLWVRDGAAGIGTVTFRDPVTGAFAGLGHAVCDAESKTPFPLQKGAVCQATIESILKGENGKAGEIRGKLTPNEIGSLSSNTPHGVYGTITTPPSDERPLSIGLKDEVKPGKATILSTLDQGGKKEYEIEIQEILAKDRDTKNFIIHVTDPALLEKTGGIIQGMSGSPIIQNGKLIGAVTHVLVGDPTRGYGIFIENMLSAMPE
jgi:stage IV sporulation protein B